MTDRCRVAVVGLGVGTAHLLAYQARPDLFEVVALCDQDVARAESRARKAPDARVLSSIEDVCASDDIDIVSICTPPFLHGEQVAAVLAAGKVAVCEKPLVGSLREVDALAALEKQTGGRVMPVFQYRYGNGLQKLRALLDAGLAGRPFTATVEVAWLRGRGYYEVPWRGRWETELGGVLLSHCVHAMDLATWVLGPVARVFARTAVRVNAIDTEDCASVSMELAAGGFLSLSATLGSTAEISRYRFCFEGLTAESGTAPYTSTGDPWTFTAADVDGQAAVDAVLAAHVEAADGYQRQLELLHAAITTGGDLPVDIADARRSIELVTAMYASARTGDDVALPIANEHEMYDGWQP
jgi:predicted dehydrogenase